jgi:hypothetical protein
MPRLTTLGAHVEPASEFSLLARSLSLRLRCSVGQDAIVRRVGNPPVRVKPAAGAFPRSFALRILPSPILVGALCDPQDCARSSMESSFAGVKRRGRRVRPARTCSKNKGPQVNVGACFQRNRRVASPPQVANLPHRKRVTAGNVGTRAAGWQPASPAAAGIRHAFSFVLYFLVCRLVRLRGGMSRQQRKRAGA